MGHAVPEGIQERRLIYSKKYSEGIKCKEGGDSHRRHAKKRSPAVTQKIRMARNTARKTFVAQLSLDV